MIRGGGIFCVLLLSVSVSYGQISDQSSGLRPNDFELAKRDLDFHTLTLDQFFAKFNGEEGVTNAPIQNEKSWKNSLYSLFDLDLFDPLADTMLAAFVEEVLAADIPTTHLDFADESWYAQVDADFIFEDQVRTGTLFLKMEQQQDYSWWSIAGLDLPFLDETKIAQKNDVFIPSNNQNLNYSALKRYLRQDSTMSTYFSLLHSQTRFSQLFLFMYALQNGYLELNEIKDISFVFSTFPGWTFTVKHKPGMQRNAGWLITQLQRRTELVDKVSSPFFFIDPR